MTDSQVNHDIFETVALVAIGGNMSSAGPPERVLADAITSLAKVGLRVGAVSPFFRTAAFPAGSGPDFVNAAFALHTTLVPEALLERLHEVEAAFGRTRRTRWAARILDLDLLAYGDQALPDEAEFRRWHELPPDQARAVAPDALVLPHPRMHERDFVLVPLARIAPEWRHPVLGQTVAEMLAALPPGEAQAPVEIGCWQDFLAPDDTAARGPSNSGVSA